MSSDSISNPTTTTSSSDQFLQKNILVVAPHGKLTRHITLQLLTEKLSPAVFNRRDGISSPSGVPMSPLGANTVTLVHLYLLTRSRQKTLGILQNLFTKQFVHMEHQDAKKSLVAFLNGENDTVVLDNTYKVQVHWMEGDCVELVKKMAASTSSVEQNAAAKRLEFDSAIICINMDPKKELELVKEASALVIYGCIRRLVYVSAAGVERPYWLPSLLLNCAFHMVIQYKLYCENEIRRACRSVSVPYCIVRPVGLTNAPGLRRKVNLAQGDSVSGKITIPREDVAAVCIACLGLKRFMTFSLASSSEELHHLHNDSVTQQLQYHLVDQLDDDVQYDLYANHGRAHRIFVGGILFLTTSLTTLALMQVKSVRERVIEESSNLYTRLVDGVCSVVELFRKS